MYGFLALGKSRFLQKMFITLKAAPINSDFELVSVVKMLPIRKVEIITCPKMFEVKPEVSIIRYTTKPCVSWLLPVTKDNRRPSYSVGWGQGRFCHHKRHQNILLKTIWTSYQFIKPILTLPR